MGNFSLFTSRCLMAVSNVLLLICGILLVTTGLVIFFDYKKILLSQMLTSGALAKTSQPILFYIGIGIVGTGLFLLITSVVGCWLPCVENYYLLTVYMLLIITVLVGECGVYAIFLAGPNCLGIEIDSKYLTKRLREDYGNVDAKQEQFTTAVDLVQTLFGCCGIESANEYDTSLWRLQAAEPYLAVPLTCCKLENINETDAYLNPKPLNSTLCQALETDTHVGYRHTAGCEDYLQKWFTQHFLMFLALGLGATLSEFVVLLSTMFMCFSIYKRRYKSGKSCRRFAPKLKNMKTVGPAFEKNTKENEDSNEARYVTTKHLENRYFTSRYAAD